VLSGGCRATARSPFSEEGSILFAVVNQSTTNTRVIVRGGEQALRLGLVFAQETRRFELPWVGTAELVAELSRSAGGERYETMPFSVKPGDQLVLTIERDLYMSRLRYGRAREGREPAKAP
jgi:hypothetical protein